MSLVAKYYLMVGALNGGMVASGILMLMRGDLLWIALIPLNFTAVIGSYKSYRKEILSR